MVNIRRHMRLWHPDTVEETIQKKRIFERKECGECGLVTRRLDLHLQRMHGMQKGQELQAAVKMSRYRKDDNPAVVSLHNCLIVIVSRYSMNI